MTDSQQGMKDRGVHPRWQENLDGAVDVPPLSAHSFSASPVEPNTLKLRALIWFVAIYLPLSVSQAEPLVGVGDTWRYLKTHKDWVNVPSGWQSLGFNDAEWESGPSGFSIGSSGYYREATLLGSSEFAISEFSAVLFRREFTVQDKSLIRWLVLRVDYDDGFVASVTGVEIARRGLDGPPGSPVGHTTFSSSAHAMGNTEEIDVSANANLLGDGSNVLSIQLHNAWQEGTDFGLVPELLSNFPRGPFVQNASSRSIQVIWKTPLPTDAMVEFGLAPSLGSSVAEPFRTTVHALTLTNLAPATRYYYRVSSSTPSGDRALSAIADFTTLSEGGDVHFAVIGDSGQGSVGQYRVAGVLERLNPDLVLHSGDVIYPSFTEPRADTRCFSVYQKQMKRVPFYFTIGNHDVYSGVSYYLDAFFLPTNSVRVDLHGMATTPEHYYSFDHGDAHFSVLYQPIVSQYKMAVGDPQYQWLTNDLAKTTKPWKFMLFHMPMRTSSLHRFDNYNLNGIYDRFEVQEVVWPVAARYGVQLVITGHDHSYERFSPVDGVHCVVTGGGGGIPYGLQQRDELSAQFRSVYHCLDITITGGTLALRALDGEGREFDSMVIQRTLPPLGIIDASWNHPALKTQTPDDGDGNVRSQTFDLLGKPIPTLSGQFSNLGQVFVNNDSTNLYLGFKKVMIAAGQDIFLFVGTSRKPGVSSLTGLGNGILDLPGGQGVDGLDFLENLFFKGFEPSIGAILGDEFADGTWRDFARRQGPMAATGQGFFRLDAGFSSVLGGQLQQFNLPQQPVDNSLITDQGASLFEQNADCIAMSIPLVELGAQPGDTVKVAAVVGLPRVSTNKTFQAHLLDTGFLGTSLVAEANNQWIVSPVELRLATSPDTDGDALSDADEAVLGTRADLPDTDSDGLPDGWEVIHGLDPLSGVGPHGAEGDFDHDGLSNLDEYAAGTSPVDSKSTFWLTGRFVSPSRIRLEWNAKPGQTYTLEKSNQAQGHYEPLSSAGFVRKAEHEIEWFEIELSPHAQEVLKQNSGFFRVRTQR